MRRIHSNGLFLVSFSKDAHAHVLAFFPAATVKKKKEGKRWPQAEREKKKRGRNWFEFTPLAVLEEDKSRRLTL